MNVIYIATVQTILENKQRGLKRKRIEDDDSTGNRQGMESTRGRGGRGIGGRGGDDRRGRGRGDRGRRGRHDRGGIVDSRRERGDGGKVTMASK